MVGSLWECVGDWVNQANDCTTWGLSDPFLATTRRGSASSARTPEDAFLTTLPQLDGLPSQAVLTQGVGAELP